jgi:general secretion pathway protein D
LKSLNPLRTFRLLTVAYAASWPAVIATLPAVVPTGVIVAISSTSERVSAQQGLLPPLPPSTLPPAGSLPALGQGSSNPGNTVAIPPASANPSPKEQCLALAAQSKLALQKGDLVNAKRWIDQALALKVADGEFASGAIKPREVAMEIDRAMRLRGLDPRTVMAQAAQAPSSPLSSASTSRVATAGAISGQGTPVQSGLYQPAVDASSIAKASGQADAASQETVPATDAQLSGNQWYEKGLEALARDDRESAKQCFTNAWKKKDELDPNARLQLKDKLAYLQSRSEPEAVSAIPTQDREALQRKQRLFAEVSGEIAEAERMVNDKPYEAIDRLKSLRTRVSQSDVDGAYRKQMLAMVDRVTTNVESWMDTNRASIELDQRNRQIEDRISLDETMQGKEDAQIQTLVDQYNELMDDQRFAEAEVIARKVEEIKPNSEIASLMRGRSVIERRVAEQKEIQAMKEEALVNSFTDAERASATYLTDSQPLQFPPVKEWYDLKKYRDKYSDDSLKLQPSERQILDLLEEPFSASFEERPLADAIKTISEMTGLIILIDEPSIAEEGLRSDQPISLDLRGNRIKLKNVLKNMLEPLNLTYVVKNEVVKIQSRRFMQQEMYSKTYSVRDLVIPIANFISDNNTGMGGALQAAYQAQDSFVAVNMPEQDAMALRNSKMASIDPNTNVLAQFAGVSPGAAANNSLASMFGADPMAANGTLGALGGGSMANFSELMRLIETTISPDGWQSQGGTATMSPFSQNLSLIVNAPQETHEQIADLLKSLRALQNLQVTIEVRFIKLSDSFFEKMGVNFQIALDDNTRNRLPREDSGPSIAIGVEADPGSQNPNSLVPTADFDIRLTQGSFGTTVPSFGGFDPGAGSTIGVAILSDIEMFLFLQAAQGNKRSNVLQAPKVTMFDGQFGTINDTTTRPFVLGYAPIVGDFAVGQRPIIVVLSEGTQMNVQPVVSPDKRFVRLTMMPQFTRLGATDREFTFQGRKSTKTGTSILNPSNGIPTAGRNNEEEIVEGITSVSTTVTVPDGGTILMGGIKRLSEERIEKGTPILSKIPYINRLFKNNAIGRDTETLMFTVTPRIIIPEEEEEQLGIAARKP